MTVARLLWRAAGCPRPAGAVDVEAVCWWCAIPSDVAVRQSDAIPDTFADHHFARGPAGWVCAACAWTLSDQIALPAEIADAGLGRRLEDGGRLRVVVGDETPGRIIPPRLFLRLADGRIGVWTTGANAAADQPWLDARVDLRTAPADVGSIRLLTVVESSAIRAGATARFRNYHHLGTSTSWRPLTAANKAEIRSFLCEPPAEFAAVIGDGQKHAAIYAEVATATRPCCWLTEAGGSVRWSPGDLARWIAAYEGLILGGAGDDEIASGRYTRGTVEMRIAAVRHDATIAPIRGSGRLALAAYLRRPRKELENG